MELTPTQVILLGIVAAIVAQAFKLIAAKLGKPVDRKIITGVLFVVAVVFGWIWGNPTLPAFPAFADDPGAFAVLVVAWLGALIEAASGIIGVAVGIYNLLLEKVFSVLNVGSEAIKRALGG